MTESDLPPRLIDVTPQSKLGVGSVGEVWRALSGEHVVAVKSINQPSTEAQRKSIETEIDALKRLNHPAIPQLYDYDLAAERPCIVMEFVEGEPFHRLIADGTLWQIPLPRRLDILAEIADAAAYLHEQGLIHRDIKPANIIGVESPHLIDYGIAVEIGAAVSPAGTPFYLFPGDVPPGIAHDLFGFALTAYEFLFGAHALFTPDDGGLPRDDLRQMILDRLHERSWRLPSHLREYELPYDLRGVDLTALDALFEGAFAQALDPGGADPGSLGALVEGLRAALLTPENQPYIQRMPEMAASWVSAEPLDTSGASTVHPDEPEPTRSRRLLIGAITGAGILIAAALALVLLQNSFR